MVQQSMVLISDGTGHRKMEIFSIFGTPINEWPFMLFIFSTIFITLALFFYSLGVWAERIAKYLKSWHVVTFWTGFVFDVLGTTLMHFMSDDPFNLLDSHTLTGQIALWLMLAHATWATIVVRTNQETLRLRFHRYSLIVWLIWLIPYFGGMFMAMAD